jgi:hypothetical protein
VAVRTENGQIVEFRFDFSVDLGQGQAMLYFAEALAPNAVPAFKVEPTCFTFEAPTGFKNRLLLSFDNSTIAFTRKMPDDFQATFTTGKCVVDIRKEFRVRTYLDIGPDTSQFGIPRAQGPE